MFSAYFINIKEIATISSLSCPEEPLICRTLVLSSNSAAPEPLIPDTRNTRPKTTVTRIPQSRNGFQLIFLLLKNENE
jgi:hypothetical protein